MDIFEKVEIYEFENEKEFNAIRLSEDGNEVDTIVVEAMVNGEYKEIYNQDEMGERTGIVDMVKTKKVRVTTTSKTQSEKNHKIDFEKAEAIERIAPFRVVSYIVAPFREGTYKAFDEKLKITTDAILLGFCSWDENGNYIFKSENAIIEKNISELKSALIKENSSANLWLEAGGFGGNKEFADKAFSTPKIRANFIKQTLDILIKYDFVGIDIDYEYPDGQVQWKNFDMLIIELKRALAQQNKMVSLALSAWGITLSKAAIESIDQVQVMLYDTFDDKRRHSNYAIIEKGISYFTKLGFKKDKLNLGLSLYGREIDKEAKERWPSYSAMANSNIITKDTNAIDGTYFTGVTMNKDKTFKAIEENCGGVMTWHYSCDLSFENELSIYRGINEVITKFIK